MQLLSIPRSSPSALSIPAPACPPSGWEPSAATTLRRTKSPRQSKAPPPWAIAISIAPASIATKIELASFCGRSSRAVSRASSFGSPPSSGTTSTPKPNVIPSFRKSLADLQLDYLDLYLVHWPFPNFHPPGCDVSSRSPDAKPYIHENFMKTWRQMEKLVDLGLVRHIGTSQHDHSQAQAPARATRASSPRSMKWSCTRTSSSPSSSSSCEPNGIEPVGYCPIGSPGRPGARPHARRHRRHRRPRDRLRIARRLGVHPAVVCVKWAVQRGADAHPVLGQSAQLPGQPPGRGQRSADRRGDGSHRGN